MRYFKVSLLVVVVALAGVGVLVVYNARESARPESNVIGISKIVAHPALDAVEQGIIDELRELGFSDLTFDVQNANGDISTAASIATKFHTDGVRLAVGIATPTSQALVNAITTIPVVYSAVTNPVEAGLVDSFDAGRGNVTGLSDMTPVAAQFDLIQDVIGARTVGHVFASGEANAVSLAGMAREAAAERGMEFVEATVVNSSEVRAAVQSVARRVDVLYVSTDNTVVSALAAVTDVATAAGLPVVLADATSAMDGGVVLALGFDYYKLGRATGRLVADILNGADPASIPTQFMTDPSDLNLLVNLDVAADLGLDIPADLLAEASLVIENGQLR